MMKAISIKNPLIKALASVVLFVGVFIIFGSLVPYFMTYANLINITRQSAMTAMCAVGLSVVIITGGIDLATPGFLAVCPMISGVFVLGGMDIYLAFFLGIAIGTAVGFLNGVLIANLRIQPFIATYVMGQIGTGVALVLSDGASLRNLPREFMDMGNNNVVGIPISTLIMISFALVGALIMARTKVGKHIYGIGGSEQTVRFEGVDTRKVKYFCYTLSAFCSSSAGILLSSQLNTVHPTQGASYMLDAVAAAVIGGISLMGGEGKVQYAVIGALFMGALRNALTMLSMHPFYQNLFVGAAVILVASISVTSKIRKTRVTKVF